MTTAYARRTDPATSHEAARVATKSTAKTVVLAILKKHGPLHDDGILAIHDEMVRKGLTTARSPQRLRTARRELCDENLVREYKEQGRPVAVKLATGYASQIWEATSD